MKRGLTEACILKLLTRGDSYGYQLVREAEEVLSISESTLYPVLRRLETSGALRVYSIEHNGRLRKYYSITEQGRGFLKELENSWDELTSAVNSIKENHNN